MLAEAVRPLSPSSPSCRPSPSRHAFGFRGNITRKWWLACECRYHFLARYQPALPVITAPPGLRHGLLDKPPTAKVYCVFHVPSPSILLLLLATSLIPSCSIGISYGVSLFLIVSLFLALSPFAFMSLLSLPLSPYLPLSLWCYVVPLRKVPLLPYPRFSHFRHSEMYRIV